MKTLLKSPGILTPTTQPFTVKASGSYENIQYQVIQIDDAAISWIEENSAYLNELDAQTAMTWIVRLQNPFKKLSDNIQALLDNQARERNYDGILSACSYATSTNAKFKAEGQALVQWRDSVWATCYAVMDDVLAGNRGIPTQAELISEMPAFEWPEVVS